MILSIPAMAGLIVLAEQLLFTLFKYGSFDSYDVNMSALSLLAYSVGLPAFILMKVLLTGFFFQARYKNTCQIWNYSNIL